jgi:1-aminocyclopropane-1-carboxylate deaminase/D-cysteine desulfhydrase-like pyridoxal-dependent ACC family enzyme
MADAIGQGANTVVTVGGVQSNHCRQTAAAAARLGLKCELILPHLSRFHSSTYEVGGNILLDRLLGAAVHIAPDRDAAAGLTRKVLEQVRERGDTPYFIPAGGSTALGALGYVDAALELARQAQVRNLKIDCVVVTTGSSTTHAGLVVGFAAIERMPELDCRPRVIGMSVYQRREGALATVRERARETAELVGLADAALDERVVVYDDYLGVGYGEPTEAMVEAVGLAGRLEGLLVDPVYTGKTLSGLIDLVRRRQFAKTQNVVFWHTGGTPALFPYAEALVAAS